MDDTLTRRHGSWRGFWCFGFAWLLLVGLEAPTRAVDLVAAGSVWAYFKGHSEASAPDPMAWRQPGFDDTRWAQGNAPFYYGEALTGTALDDMRNNYTCVFLRRTFVVTNPANCSELVLGAVSDDGFVCWINGREVARYNMPPGELAYDQTSLGALQEPIPFEYYILQDPGQFLVPGTNTLAIQAFNTSLGSSSDFVIDASLSASVDETGPVMAQVDPPPGAWVRQLTSLEVVFSEPVRGVDAGDLRVNDQPATNVTAFGTDQYVFEFAPPLTGLVQIAWSAQSQIRDLASTPNSFLGGTWSYTLDPTALPPGLLLSEFMADNEDTLNDEDGDSPDWIEIHNASATPVSLNGWWLTDDTNHPAKWRFPKVSVAANGFLLVFASEKNRTNPLAPLHTNFRIEKSGGYLALLDPQTQVISAFAPSYPAQQADVSYGRARGNPNWLNYFTQPTPGRANTAGGPGFAPEIAFSRPGSTFTNPIQVQLSTLSSNAVIHVTLDGLLPDETSPVYRDPLLITNSVQVRARAFETGLLPGPPRSETYVAMASALTATSSDLPILVIHTHGSGRITANSYQSAELQVYAPRFGRTSLTRPPQTTSRAALKVRGSSTQGMAKQSFALETRDDWNADRAVELLGMPAESDWVLYAPNNFEPVLIHNPFMFDLSNQIGRYAPRSRFVELYLNTTGGPLATAHYNGIYVLMEKIKRGPRRVDIDNLEPEHLTPPKVTGGYLLKIDRSDPGDSGFYAAGQGIQYVDPKELEIDLPQRQPQAHYIRDYLNEFAQALHGPNPSDPVTGYDRYIDVDSWIDHHLLNILAFNVDALRLSAFFYKPREGKLNFGPLWDFDRALGSTDGRDLNPRVWRAQTGDRGTDFFNYPWWGELFSQPDFWQRYIDRWQELRQGAFAMSNLEALVESLTSQVRQAQPREAARWPSMTRPRNGSYPYEVNFMKQWLKDRAEWIDGQFLAAPISSLAGGSVPAGSVLRLTGPTGAIIYYTLNGTDPRTTGGGISPSAISYQSPITVNANARLFARCYNSAHANLTGPNNPPISSPWSGPVTRSYVVNPPTLIVTELMYHPAATSNDPGLGVEEFEYLELKNIGPGPCDLSGARFSRGIDFIFPPMAPLAPGQRILVVKNRAAFAARYGNPPAAVAGEYGGYLDNAGERLTLVGAMEESILDFTYNNSWYATSDGLGFALVSRDESASPPADASLKTSWQPSALAQGSPGAAEPDRPPMAEIVFNEILTHPLEPGGDAVELLNLTESDQDIGYWFLTDDRSVPQKVQLPHRTMVPAEGYLVLTEHDFNVGSNGFALGAKGDEVYLFAADAQGNLTGYSHGFRFGAADPGTSFGRWFTSTGAEKSLAQKRVTLGANNSGPRVGPIIINEIMYHPSATHAVDNEFAEFVELYNTSRLPVTLGDATAPSLSWSLDDGISFTFPAGAVMPPRSYGLAVPFNPITEPDATALFRARYALSPAVPLWGPFRGDLRDSGERIALLKPVDPNPVDPPAPPESPSPAVLVDEVEYDSVTPWPSQARGTGASLQRFRPDQHGDDPEFWRAGTPTPGRPNSDSSTLDSDQDGMPDEWEWEQDLYPYVGTGDWGAAGDPDQDGFRNRDEYRSGTDPNDPASCLKLRVTRSASGETHLAFQAMPGKSYAILFRDQADPGPWQLLQSITPQPIPAILQIIDPNPPSTGSRFYQAATPGPP